VRRRLPALEAAVVKGELPAAPAARQLLDIYLERDRRAETKTPRRRT